MEKEILEGLAGLLNKSAEEVATLFDTDEESKETKLKPAGDVLATFRAWVKDRTDDVYKAAQRKKAQEFESWVKSQGFTSDAQGTDLLAAYFEAVNGSAGSGDPTEAEKKAARLEDAVKKLQEALAGKDAEIEKARQEGHRQVVAARLTSDVRKYLGQKWAGTDDHLKILLGQLSPDRIRYDGDEPTLLNEQGEPLTDELHRPIKFADHVQGLGKLIGGFHAVDPGKGSPGAPAGGNGGGNSVSLPANLDGLDFQSLLTRETDPAKRAALIKARREQLEKK